MSESWCGWIWFNFFNEHFRTNMKLCIKLYFKSLSILGTTSVNLIKNRVLGLCTKLNLIWYTWFWWNYSKSWQRRVVGVIITNLTDLSKVLLEQKRNHFDFSSYVWSLPRNSDEYVSEWVSQCVCGIWLSYVYIKPLNNKVPRVTP